MLGARRHEDERLGVPLPLREARVHIVTRRVVLSSDTHPDYAFYLPLTALIWSLRGWEPTVIAVGGDNEWRRSPLREAVAAAREVAGSFSYLDLPGLPFKRTSTVAQVSRLFGWLAAGTQDDDLVVTSDIDMWPIGPWVLDVTVPTDAFTILGANAHMDTNGRPTRFPICYLAARAATWRDVIGDTPSIAAGVDRVLAVVPAEYGTHRGVPLGEWCLDESYFFGRVWAGHLDRCRLVARDLAARGQMRLDRAAWHENWRLADLADAHLPRPGYSDENWPRVRRLLARLVPDLYLRWADSYRKGWLS